MWMNWQVEVSVVSRIGECNDEEDNDGDELIDLFDPDVLNSLIRAKQTPILSHNVLILSIMMEMDKPIIQRMLTVLPR